MSSPAPRPLRRRELLRGAAGAAVGLPFLEAMAPARASRASSPPTRLVWIHTESGMWMPSYTPRGLGAGFELSETLGPLAPFQSELTVLSGLFHANAFKRNPQTGRHVQDGMCHLTGADLGGTPGVAVRNSVSVDQLAAEAIGGRTRLPSLGLTVGRGPSLSYAAGGAAVPAEWDPRAVFARLFGGNSPDARARSEERFRRDKSVLDEVREATGDLSRKLGAADRRKLDEYLGTIREVERRAAVARAWSGLPAVPAPPGAKDPGPAPEKDRTAYVRTLLDLLVLALQADQTRLATARIGFMGCQYPDIGCPDSYHGYTHHDFRADRQAAMAKVDRHRIGLLAEFLGKLRAIREGEHDLLHHSVIHYGAGMGADHESTALANLVVGRGGGALRPAGHIDYRGKPLANLYLGMLGAAGVGIGRFADSTGPLEGI